MRRRMTGTRLKARAGERGVSLILVMLSMLVLSVLAATIVFTARSEALASYNWRLDTQADYLAKAGIQQAINWLRSSRYAAVSPTDAATYYNVTLSGGTYNTATANQSPVTCRWSGCTNTGTTSGSTVQLISITGTGSSNYPNNGSYSNVASYFAQDLAYDHGGFRVTGDARNSGLIWVNLVLLNYQTVERGTPPNLTPAAMETWLITSRANWTGLSSASGMVATAEEQAIVQPIYLPTWGNALYGYCSVSMSGSSGVCTDAFNSVLGAYGDGTNKTAAGNCTDSSTTNEIDAGAGVGANGYVSLGGNVTVAGNVTIGSGPAGGSSCCSGSACGYQGSTSSVLGQVVSGPSIPTPSVPTFPSNLSSAPSVSGTVTYPQSCNIPALSASSSGGSLATGVYFYTVTALGSWGESTEGEANASVTGPNGSVTVSWSAVSGATGYHVYRGTTSGGENVYYNITSGSTTSYANTVAAGTAGAPPGGVVMWPPSPMTAASASNTSGSPGLGIGVQECYVVTAVGSGFGETAPGAESCATTASSKKSLSVSWSAYPGASGYRVYRGPTAAPPASENQYWYTTSTSITDPADVTSWTSGTPPVSRWSQFSAGTGANPPFYGCSAPCITSSPCDGNGTVAAPFSLSSVTLHNNDVLQLIGGKDILHPVYYEFDSIDETGGSIIVSGYTVMNVKSSLSIKGNGAANPVDYNTSCGVSVNVPPECVQIRYAGTSGVALGGNGAISAVIMAPNADVTMKGGGSGGYMVGAVQAKNVIDQGGYPIHYDVQLNKAGGQMGVMTTTGYSRKKF